MLLRGNTDERRRLALQIASQLPEKITEAFGVLDDTRELVAGFLIKGPRLVALPDAPASSAAPIVPSPASVLRRYSPAVALASASFLAGLCIGTPPILRQAIAALALVLT